MSYSRMLKTIVILVAFVYPAHHAFAAEPLHKITLDQDQMPLAIGYRSAWVWNATHRRIEQIDLDTGATTEKNIPLAFDPHSASVEDASLWVCDTNRSLLARIDLNTFEVTAVIDIDAHFETWEFVTVITGEGTVWVKGEEHMLRIDPDTNRVWGEPIPAGEEILSAAVYDGELWVGSHDDGLITRIDVATNQTTSQFDIGFSVHGLAVGEGAAWVLDEHGFAVVEIDRATNTIKSSVPITFVASNIIIGNGSLWIAPALYDGGNRTTHDAVTQLDLQSDRNIKDIPIGNLNASEYYLLQVEDEETWLVAYGSTGRTSSLVRLSATK